MGYNNTDPGSSPNQPVGAVLSVNYGTTTSGVYDQDLFGYDTNTERLTQYIFGVGGQTDMGVLTWNANGSLYEFQITDHVSGSTDTQNCYYTHDDLGRIASVNCANGPTNVWQQNFSFDPLGNITKTGSSSFQPTYTTNPPTNRMTSGAGYSYDSNGNLTADATGGHSYQWDAESRPTCIDNIVQTYDAMGRLVEQARGGSDCAHPGTTYQQVLYGPDGSKLALMSAQNLAKAFVPLPGGATAVYTSTGLAYYRHSDHLGSSRLATTPARGLYYAGAYAPFGENYAECTNPPCSPLDRSFTGQNQDTIGGAAPLYDFMFREQTPNQGRWISPDPAGLTAVNPYDPQSWNRYAYVGNRPLAGIDLLGLECIAPNGMTLGEGDATDCDEHGGNWVDGGPSTGCYLDGVETSCGAALSQFGNDFDAMQLAAVSRLAWVQTGDSGYFAFYYPNGGLLSVLGQSPSGTRFTSQEIADLVAANNMSSVDDKVVQCLIRTESQGDPNAVPLDKHHKPIKGATARGLMQVTRGAAAYVAKIYSDNVIAGELSGPQVYSLLWDPAYNITIGTAYLETWVNYPHNDGLSTGLFLYGDRTQKYVTGILGCAGIKQGK